jgi:hypothetical protein
VPICQRDSMHRAEFPDARKQWKRIVEVIGTPSTEGGLNRSHASTVLRKRFSVGRWRRHAPEVSPNDAHSRQGQIADQSNWFDKMAMVRDEGPKDVGRHPDNRTRPDRRNWSASWANRTCSAGRATTRRLIEAADAEAALDALKDHPFIGRGGVLQIREPVEF